MDLSAREWRDIAKLWRDVAQLSYVDVEQATERAADTILTLMDGTHLLLVIHRRVGPASLPLGGLRPIMSREVGPGSGDRLQKTRAWMQSEPELHKDPILRRVADGIGSLRTVRHRADFDDQQWRNAAVRRLLAILEVEDRINGIVPISHDVEVSFVVDRPSGAVCFDDRDALVMESLLGGLRPLAASFVRSHGLMPGQRMLDPLERRIVDFMLSDLQESQVSDMLEIDQSRLDTILEETFRKLGVDDRVGLMRMWLEGASDGYRLRPDVREEDMELLQSPPEDRVRKVLQNLAADDFEIDVVARRLGMSTRSLQRALNQADASYTELADAARRKRAQELLAHRSLSLTEIALRLGYEQASSFNRAVRRWVDMTPGQWREALYDDD
jgi:AraC-like DNA-binding protein